MQSSTRSSTFRNDRYNYPLPLIPGTNAICRIAAVPQDTPDLKPGMLVYSSSVVRHRDNTMSEAPMQGEWRNGTWAELIKVPAENVHVLNEQVLTKEFDYKIAHPGYISTFMVAYGGLSDVGLRPCETIVVAPATGNFGSAAVFVALAMGAAKVIAMGRNTEKLQKILEGTGNRRYDPIGIYFDLSPKLDTTPSHISSAISSLRLRGRISFMGGIRSDVQISYLAIVVKGLTLHGTFMYTRQQINELIALVETGLLPIGSRGGFEVTGKFSIEQWEEALEYAYNHKGPKKATYFIPNGEQERVSTTGSTI
ncbi:GroES-like protein [Xylaria telfairii]|nr:GroES-like protein [Xylaria telfairii]